MSYDMMEGILAYVRSWFPKSTHEDQSRKRRPPSDSFHQVTSPKCRKVLSPMSNNIDDELFVPSTRSPVRLVYDLPRTSFSDDILTSCKRPNRPKDRKFSPMTENKTKALLNGNDDVVYVGTEKTRSEKHRDAKKANFAYITKFSPSLEAITIKTPQTGTQNKPKMSPILKTPTCRNRRPVIRSPSLDYSVQLEDKQKYRELLDNVAMHGSFYDASIYSTPIGQLLDYNVSKRTRNIVERATSASSKQVEIVDLTERKPRLSTKDAVKKVLEDFDSEIAVVDDSDSDVEVLPTPPSPKPDIKVDPVNSLKTVIDTSKAAHPKWLDEFSTKHDRYVQDKEREIKAYTENSSTLSEINRHLLIKSLSKKVEDSLAIRDTILPVDEEEEEAELPLLTDEHVRMLKRAFSGDPNEVLTKKFNLNVTRRDFQTLAGLNWLNDNVINFYMNLIIERGTDNSKWPKSYAMNTFFYQKLLQSGPDSLKRWTRRVDIFSKHFICVPIHLGMHWCMAIIDLKARTIKYYDSMGKDNNQCLSALRSYLEFEHMDKKGSAFDTSDFLLENVQNIPQQMNGSDCGMFACTFAEFATRKARFSFDQSDMPYFRKKMVIEILTGQLLIN